MRFLTVILVLLAMKAWSYGQSKWEVQLENSDLLFEVLGEEAEEICSFITEHQLLDSFEIQDLAPDAQLKSVLTRLEDAAKSMDNLGTLSGIRLSWDNFYMNTDTILRGTAANWQSQIRMEKKVELGKFPLQIKGTAVLLDGQFNQNFSNLSLSFDERAFLERQRAELLQSLHFRNLLKKKDNLLGLTTDARRFLKNELRVQFFQRIITQQKFNQLKATTEGKVDTIKLEIISMLTDSVTLAYYKKQRRRLKELPAYLDSARIIAVRLDSVWAEVKELKEYTNIDLEEQERLLLQLNKISQGFRNSWEEKKEYGQETINELKLKVEKFSTFLENYDNPEFLRKKLLKKKKMKWHDKILAWTRNFDLGLFHLQGSSFTLNSLSLTGLRYGFDFSGSYGTIAYGSQSFNSSFIPVLTNNLFQPFVGRKMLFAQAGIGDRSSDYLQLSFLSIKDGNNPEDSLLIYPKNNTIVSLEGQNTLGDHLQLKTELAFANHDLVGTNRENGNRSIGLFNSAAEVTIQYSKKDLSLAIGYFQIGPEFISLGNPFLLTNRRGLLLNTELILFNKLSIDFQSKIGRSIEKNLQFDDELADWQLLGGITYRSSNNNTLTAKVSPNTFRQSGTGNFNTSGNNMLYLIQSQVNTKLGSSTNLLSLAAYSNFRSTFNYFDTTTVDKSHYLLCQESVLFTNQHQLNLTFSLGGEGLNIQETLVQISYGFSIQQLEMSFGGQIFRDKFYNYWSYGITGRLIIPLRKWGVIMTDILFQRPWEKKLNGGKRIAGQMNFRITI